MKTQQLTRFALLTALAMVLSWLESVIPLPALPPGVKLGLPNLVVIFALYRLGPREAAMISLVRVVLVTFTFGNAYAFFYSIAGAAVSMALMCLLRATGRFGEVGVSVAGGVGHNIAQVAVAAAILRNGALAGYLPVLLAAGTGAGCAIGGAAAVLLRRVDRGQR